MARSTKFFIKRSQGSKLTKMATIKVVVFLFAILVPSTIILAQEPAGSSSEAPEENSPAPAASSAPGLFGHFPFGAPGFNFSRFFPEFASPGSGEMHIRRKRSVINCNYAKHGFAKCLSCKQARRCYPWNIGTLTTCGGFLPYCNNGFCSTVKGSLCTSTNSTSSNSTSSNSTG